MQQITWEEAKARTWLSKHREKKAKELKDARDKSHNAEYDFY